MSSTSIARRVFPAFPSQPHHARRPSEGFSPSFPSPSRQHRRRALPPCVTNTPLADLAAQAQGASFTQRLTLNHSPNIHQNTQLTHQASIHPKHTAVSKTLFLVSIHTFSTGLPVGVSISNLEHSIQFSLHLHPLLPLELLVRLCLSIST